MPPSAPWPTIGEYSAAIQNPRYCFADQELTRGQTHTDQRGMPTLAAGNFAVVYQLQSGARVFAVRCFTQPVTNQQQRYDALSQHLRGLWLSSLVDFAYVPQGVRVQGQWYPIVRMEWISGKPMHQYVEDHLRQDRILELLARQWRGVVAGLRGLHMAHGDLQHGNILVDEQDQLRLVDYDGLFIPALSGDPPGEVGHPSYQHPERLQHGYYAENADAFPALVLYLSLLALRADQSLWMFHTEENLIFTSEDFSQPGRTPVWTRLRASGDPEVRRLTSALQAFCQGPVAAVPDLEMVIQSLPESVAVTPITRPLSRALPSAPAPAPTPQTAQRIPWPHSVLSPSALRAIQLCMTAWRQLVAFLRPSPRWGLVAVPVLAAFAVWWWIHSNSAVQAPTREQLWKQVVGPWRAGACSQAEAVLRKAQHQQPEAPEPYRVGIQLLLQGGPCQEALGSGDPVVLMGEAIQRGFAESLPWFVEVKTQYKGDPIAIKAKHIRALSQRHVDLANGSRYHGTVRLKGG